jgi:undecaprenyl-diphosphatase
VPAADRDRRRQPPYRLALVVAALVAAFALWTLPVASGALRGLEQHLAAWLWSHQWPPLTAVAEGFARIGVWWVLAPAALVAALLLARGGRRGQGVYVVLALVVAQLLNVALKELVKRSPPATDAASASTYAYPSGHTMAATSLAAALVFVAWPTRWRIPALVGGVSFALLMGLSRVYLTVHWPSDVVAGWLLGSGVAVWLRLVMDAAFRPGTTGPASDSSSTSSRRGIHAAISEATTRGGA